jgi:8-oxo-dGTP diphosphatase
MSSNAVDGAGAAGDDRRFPERPILAVGGVVIHDSRVLLIRRGRPPLEGRWSIPGGILEIGETIAEGVARELKEETAIRVRVMKLLEIYEKVLRDGGNRAQYHFVILDYLCELTEGTATAGSDVREILWAEKEQLASLTLTAAASRVIDKAFAAVRRRAARRR